MGDARGHYVSSLAGSGIRLIRPLEFVAINVSSRQLEFCDPASWIRPGLERSGIDPSRVEIEVTETVAMGDLAAAQASLRALRELGLTIAIDDFGTGYSSLSYLHSLPITTVKIDRSFISRLVRRDGSAAHRAGHRRDVPCNGASESSLRA